MTCSHKILVLFFFFFFFFFLRCGSHLRMSSTWIKQLYNLSRVWRTELQVINLETNYINVSEQIDLYMHQNASIYIFCMYIHIKYMYK